MTENNNNNAYYSYGLGDTSSTFNRGSVVDKKIDELKGNAPEEYDTLEEIAAAIQNGGMDVSGKLDKSEFESFENQVEETYAKKDDIPSVDGLFASVEYDSNSKKMVFKDKENATVGEVDASEFVKDGMIDTVEITNGNLVITFNTDSDKETITLSLSEVFDPSNFYTKEEIDNKGYLTEHQDLSEYAKTSDVNTSIETAVSTKADKSELPTIPSKLSEFDNDVPFLTEHQDLSDYALKSELPDVSGFVTNEDITAAINGIDIPVVPTNVSAFTNDSGYLTEHQSLEDYATKEMLNDYVKTEDLPEDVDLSAYALKSEVPSIEGLLSEETASETYQPKGDYLTEHQSLEGYATTEYVDDKVSEISIPSKTSELENDSNFITMSDVDDNGYLTEHQSLAGLVSGVNYVSADKKIYFTDKENVTVGTVDTTDFVKDGMVKSVSVDENNNLVITFNEESGEETIRVSLGAMFEPNNYYTKTESEARYYEKENANSVFVAKTTLENYSTTEQMDEAIDTAIEPKADKSDIEATVNALVVRLNKLEATNKYFVDNNTTSADTINNMSAEDALTTDITVSSDEAVKSLTTNKEFKNVNLIGAEVGDSDMIYLSATENVNVEGVTVSGEKGSGNGKIVYATNDITINNLNIEPGCTVYNVFEGSQDKTEAHSIDNFTATNVTVNDTDLKHNVFNIYQFNTGANVLIKDCSFNLDVVNSNIMRVSNITNADNVTITFENVDWTYENKGYADGDVKCAGLMIYQPYGSDIALNGDTTHTQTWAINVKNCRYNGVTITENNVGEITQSIYQYNVGNTNLCEAPNAFGSVTFE